MANKKATPKKSTKSKKQKKREEALSHKLLRWGFVVCIWGGLLLMAVLAWYGKDLGKIAKRVADDQKRIVKVYARDGKTELAAYGHLKGPNVRVEDLAQHIPNAFIAIEDRRFYSHFGIDLIGLTRAMAANVRAGGVVQGGSTITQQLAKNLFFNPERTLKRKIQEAMLSLWIEWKYSKEEILSAYLNHVYFGAGAYGLDSAAHMYFDKVPADLTVNEAALLAGLMQAPSRTSPLHNPKAAIERMKVVLTSMEDLEFITEDDLKSVADIQIAEDGKIQGMDLNSRTKESHYFTDWIYRQVEEYATDTDEDLKVITTLTQGLQKQISLIVKEELDAKYPEDGDIKRPQAAAVLLNQDGAIRALVGGYDYEKSQFNRATDGLRQAGSSFKPFVYLAAIEQGMRPESTISNARIRSGRYRPSNYDGRYSQWASLREALVNSYNVAAVNLIKKIGVPHVIDIADRVGIDAEVREELSTALGTVDISLLDLTGAYATLGQKGKLVEPYGIEKIETVSGEVLYEHEKPNNPRVIAYKHVDALNSILEDVVKFGTGKRAQTGFPVAGKTGTTQDYRDALFMGFSSVYTLGVWMGNDDNTSMGKGAYGGTVPASVFKRGMQSAHQGFKAGAVSTYNPTSSGNSENLINDIFSNNSGNRNNDYRENRNRPAVRRDNRNREPQQYRYNN